MSSTLPEMIRALAAETTAIQKRGSGSQVELHGGEFVGRIGDSWLYRFAVIEDLGLRDDSPVQLTCDQRETRGQLVSSRDGVLLVSLESDLGPKIAAARLVSNDSFLVERLKERLEEIRDGKAQFNIESAERALGLSPARSGEVEPNPTVLQGVNRPNEAQLLAIRRSLGSEMTYVWGPPGTGKTTTLARIVEAHYRAGRSVLLVSNTNIAVDTALEQVANRLKGEPEFHEGLVIRQGPVVKEELRQRFGPQVVLDEIVDRLGEPLRREKEETTAKVLTDEEDERKLVAVLADFKELDLTKGSIAEREGAIATARTQETMRRLEAQTQRAKASALRADLKRAQDMSSMRRFFSGLNPEHIKKSIIEADRSATTSDDAARALAGDIAKYDAEVVALRLALDDLEAKVEAHPPAPDAEARLAAVRTKLKQLRDRIAALDKELAELRQEILANCRILATTVYRTYLGSQPLRQFDAVVIDEASMLMPPLVYLAAGLARTSVTVGGDFRQLPPIVMSTEPEAKKWLACDVFEKAGIPDRLQRGESVEGLVALRVQYRMREDICDVVNQLFYSDCPLSSDPSVSADGRGFGLGTSALMYVDTSSFNPWASFRVGTYSRYNLFHALLVRNVVGHLAETGYLPGAGEANLAVGAVTPYAAQAQLIQALLEDRLGSRAAGIASTVHRFQGNEKKAMVLDLTESFGASLGRFFKAASIQEDGTRLLNVAISRARHHVLLIGNFDYLLAEAPANAVVRELIKHFVSHGEKLDTEGLLPLASEDWIDGLHAMKPAAFDFSSSTAGAFTEGTFYPAFQKDLVNARESVVIFSPFATERGTGRWVDSLRALVARGVRVRILTRPPDDSRGGAPSDGREVVDQLRGVGVAVDLRAGMHEKIAIVDNRVLWHGSLNIFSHRDSHESMLRIDSPIACSQLARFVSKPTSRKEGEPVLEVRENPVCPKCGSPTVWKESPRGVYFECEKQGCDGSVDTRRGGGGSKSGGRKRKGSREGQSCPEPGCNGKLMTRNGRYGRFLGCSNFPRCKYTENIG